MAKQMPLDEGILKMVMEHLPAPVDVQGERIRNFCPIMDDKRQGNKYDGVKVPIQQCLSGLLKGQETEVPTTVYVTKMQPYSSRLYDITTKNFGANPNQEKQKLVAISRVFSGNLKKGQKVFVMGPRH